MAERKSFLLRLDAQIYSNLQKWADDDLRSLNGQIEYLMREALRKAGRLKPPPGDSVPPEETAQPE